MLDFDIHGKYFSKNTSENAEVIIESINKTERLKALEKKVKKSLKNLDDSIEGLESIVEDDYSDETEKDLAICKLQVLYEKRSIAEQLLNRSFFDREWLLNKVFNNGAFLTKSQAEYVYSQITGKERENTPSYQIRLKIVMVIEGILMFATPISLLLLVLPWTLCYGSRSKWVAWLVTDYPVLWLFVLSWAVPILSLAVLPNVVEGLLLGAPPETEFTKEVLEKKQRQRNVACLGILAGLIAGIKTSKKMNIKE